MICLSVVAHHWALSTAHVEVSVSEALAARAFLLGYAVTPSIPYKSWSADTTAVFVAF